MEGVGTMVMLGLVAVIAIALEVRSGIVARRRFQRGKLKFHKRLAS